MLFGEWFFFLYLAKAEIADIDFRTIGASVGRGDFVNAELFGAGADLTLLVAALFEC